MNLTPNFTLREMTRSQTAERLGIDNGCVDNEIIENLRRLCANILEPVRNEFGRFSPSSGYRSPDLERVLTGDAWKRRNFDSFEDYLAVKSHPKGQAADFEVGPVTNLGLAEWVRDHLDFDQLILEFYDPQVVGSGWVHCSYVSVGENRHQLLTAGKQGTASGLRV